ncbi:surfeit locus protein 2-like isoform X2 [Amphiura filiformis]|uniref:surfeit locus protein 2-like isoform X2 n=1 Tax=Amphiura filiformis TaxID=82378 RepID=UPI003B21F2F4
MASIGDHVDKLGAEVSGEIQTYLKKHPSLKYCKESKKIKCDLSGHEIPCKLDALKSYIEGKKYTKLRAQQEFNYKKYEPHIVQSNKKSHEHQLFCKLTVRHLNRVPSHVEKHVNGRRYKKALEKYEECQRLGIKFVPPSRQKRSAGFGGIESDGEEKRFSTNPEESGEESEAESVDSFSDLYPAEDFEMDAEDDEKDDVENMEVDSTNAAGDAKPTRRKGNKDQKKRPLEEEEEEDEEEENGGDDPRKHTDHGKNFKKGRPNKWKGKQKQQQNNKSDQSNSRTGKGKKKKPRRM